MPRIIMITALFITILPLSSMADDKSTRNVILMVADGVGFNGWMAADYFQGRAGEQSYQVERPDGTQPRLYGMTHWSLNPIDSEGALLEENNPEAVAGVREQGYDPAERWKVLENAFRNDFPPVEVEYSSYTDSAAAGTTLQTGRKTLNGRINQDWQGRDLTTIAEIADKQGMATGSVTSVMASHATPATTWAHDSSRDHYSAIFREMVSGGLDVVMGAGHPLYDSSGRRLEDGEKREYKYVGGAEFWKKLTRSEGWRDYTFIDDPRAFKAVAEGDTVPEKLIGIARNGSTLQAARSGLPDSGKRPSGMARVDNVPDLAIMSRAALNILGQQDRGFYVMIEGGAPDWMAHANNMPRFLEEQISFNQAVATVIDWVEANSSWDETLLIVTSDHETGGIWGRKTYSNETGGPVAQTREKEALQEARYNPTKDEFNAFKAVQDQGKGKIPGYQFASGNHTNEMVPLWVLGTGANRFEDFTRHDFRAASLWGEGEPYNWGGAYVDNTTVFEVMMQALSTPE